MPAPFAELEEIASTIVDATFAEQTKIVRTVKGEYFSSSAQEGELIVKGIIDLNPVPLQVQDKSQYDGFVPTLAGDKVHVSYDLSVFLDASTYPRQDDIIVATERPGEPKFRVTREPDHDGIGRMVCVCVPTQ